jgi:hypothetical protein
MFILDYFAEWIAVMRSPAQMALYEPSTALTDFLLGAAICGYVVLLARSSAAMQKSVRLWIVAFSAAALAAFSGGVYHALFPQNAPLLRDLLWKGVGLSTSVASAALLAGGIFATLRPPWRPWALVATIIKGIVFAALMWWWDDFLYIIYDYASAMLILAILQIGLRRRAPATGWLIGGIAVSFFAAAIQQSGFDLHQYLNHNDLYHLVQIVAFHLFYMGVRHLQDAKALFAKHRFARGL